MAVSLVLLYLGGVDDPAHEEDGVGDLMVDEEEEGSVNGESGGQGVRGDARDSDSGRRGSHFIHLDHGLVLHLRTTLALKMHIKQAKRPKESN